MKQAKKFNAHVGLSFLHLVVAMAIMVAYIDASQPWRGILFTVLLLSLVVWPARFLLNFFKKEQSAQ